MKSQRPHSTTSNEVVPCVFSLSHTHATVADAAPAQPITHTVADLQPDEIPSPELLASEFLITCSVPFDRLLTSNELLLITTLTIIDVTGADTFGRDGNGTLLTPKEQLVGFTSRTSVTISDLQS